MASQFPTDLDTAISGPDGDLPREFAHELVRQLGATQVDDKKMTDDERVSRWESARQALMSFVPSEPVEAMLAAQAVAAHTAAMECIRRSMITFESESTCVRLRANAASLMRSFNATLRQLERHRGWAAGTRTYRD